MNGRTTKETPYFTKPYLAGTHFYSSFSLPLTLPLFLLITPSHPHGIKVLVQNGANANIPNSIADSDAYIDGGAPIHLAAMMGELECIKVLLDNGADINSKESNEKKYTLAPCLLSQTRTNSGRVTEERSRYR